MGDFAQFPPVMRKRLFYEDPNNSLKNPLELAGKTAYLAFTESLRLETIMRQQGDDRAAFRQALGRLRENTIEEADWRLFLTRVANVVSGFSVGVQALELMCRPLQTRRMPNCAGFA